MELVIGTGFNWVALGSLMGLQSAAGQLVSSVSIVQLTAEAVGTTAYRAPVTRQASLAFFT